MWKHRRQLIALALGLGFLASGPARPFEPKGPGHPLREKEFFAPELYLSSSHRPLAEVLPELPNRAAWEGFAAALDAQRGAGRGAPLQAFVDPRSGAATNLVLSLPLIPGAGRGNRLSREDLAAAVRRPVRAVDGAAVTEAVGAFVREHAAVLGIDPAQLGAVRSVQVAPHLWQIAIPQAFQGIPVRHGRLVATLNHGNLVVIGTETWGNVRGLAPTPRLSAEQAVAAGFAHAGGRAAGDEVLGRTRLEIVPVAPPEHQQGARFAGPVGAGYRHRLVWTFVFRRPPEPARWEVMVDAHSGRVLAFEDVNHYANRTVTGSVYPVTSTEVCPTPQTCGTMLSNWPMPFADTGLPAPNHVTNSAGVYNHLGGTAATALSGRYVAIFDVCGAPGGSSPGGAINLGGTNGQHDCAKGGGSPGATASARSAFYEVNKVAEMARGWLPDNFWLQQQLPAVVNLNSTCNAFWDGFSINFFASGGGCRNTGEIAGVFDHEWGHGMDHNDAGGFLSNSSEAYADIAAAYRLQASCVGHGFFHTSDKGCGQTADGTGFNANEDQLGGLHCDLDCSGVRDADWDKHSDHTPDTALGFVCSSCQPGSGPCGAQVHCAAAPSRQAAWDLVARDLQAAPFDYDSETAFLVGNKLFYQGSGNIGEWHACTCGDSSSGCGATNAYMQWLAADDDNGDLTDGTPHMTALFNAFDRHGIACATPAPANSGCAGGPAAAPVLAGSAGSFQATLSWNAVPGAADYWVLRSEGHAGCDFGKTRIATVAGTSFTDTELANGRSYSYNVVAAGASPACFSPVSNCLTVTPVGDSACYPLRLAHTGAGADPVPAPDRSVGCAAGQYHPGDHVQLTAVPDPGHLPGSWSGTLDDAGTSLFNGVVMPASSHRAAVHYVEPEEVAAFDFETDPGLVTTGFWHLTAECEAASAGHSQPTALYYGIDDQCNYNNRATNSGTATLPPIDLAGATARLLLRFNYFLRTEGSSFFDNAAAEIAADGGPFQAVASNQPLSGMEPLSDPSAGWAAAAVDVSALADSTIELRFSFDTRDEVFNSLPGFYVDDVEVAVVPACAGASDLVLTGQTVATAETFEACHTLTAGDGFVIEDGGDATFRAFDRVILAPGFRIRPGGGLKVVLP